MVAGECCRNKHDDSSTNDNVTVKINGKLHKVKYRAAYNLYMVHPSCHVYSVMLDCVIELHITFA